MSIKDLSFEQNRIFYGLPSEVIARLEPHIERLDARLHHSVYESYEPIHFTYFPLNSMISVVALTESGQMAEIGVVGAEGAVGLDVVTGVETSPFMSMFQMAGPAFRIPAKEVVKEFRRAGAFHDRVLVFMRKMSVQVSQTTLCNRLHRVEERLPRWLLMCHDRLEGDVLPLTQEYIGLMLGTSRVSVTMAATALQQSRFITYSRGKITIIDRARLERAACECYMIVRREYDKPSDSCPTTKEQ